MTIKKIQYGDMKIEVEVNDTHGAYLRYNNLSLYIPTGMFSLIGNTVMEEMGKLPPPEFVVNEHMSGFSLTHIPSGANHWLSDGVDCLFDADGKALSPGTPGFVEAWTAQMNSDGDIMEAYFPDHVEAKYISRWNDAVEVSTPCMYDKRNKVAYNIQPSDVDVGEDAVLTQELIELEGGERIDMDEEEFTVKN